jgi:hypothetical protein
VLGVTTNACKIETSNSFIVNKQTMNETRQFVPLLKSSFDVFFDAPKDAWEDFVDKCEVV